MNTVLQIHLVTPLLISALISIISLSGCSGLGSSSKIKDANAVHAAKTIYVAPISTNLYEVCKTYSSLEFACERYSILSLTLALTNELDSLKLFTSVQPDTALANQMDSEQSLTKESDALRDARHASADAFIFCKLKYTVHPGSTVDATAEIKLIQTSTGDVLAESSHNTLWGNSYLGPPRIDRTTRDAVVGAVKALDKAITSY